MLIADVEDDELRAWLNGSGEVARILPDLIGRLPGLPEPPTIADPESAQFQLFDAMVTFLGNASGTNPLVLVLDDIHWADDATLRLLEYVAVELSRSRLLLVGTYGDVELGRQRPLERALAGISRAERCQTIDLRGLSESEMDAYVRVTSGVEPSEHARHSIHRQTEGNTFFLQEVVAQMVGEGTLEHGEVSVPQSVRSAIGRRFSSLSEECNELLRTAAVVGWQFSEELLARLSEEGTDHVSGLLESALVASAVQEDERPSEYQFAYAVIQETLLEELRTSQPVRPPQSPMGGLRGARA